MPDDYSPDVNTLDIQSHVEEICAFFMQLGVSPEQAADCILDMIRETYETFGTRH